MALALGVLMVGLVLGVFAMLYGTERRVRAGAPSGPKPHERTSVHDLQTVQKGDAGQRLVHQSVARGRGANQAPHSRPLRGDLDDHWRTRRRLLLLLLLLLRQRRLCR